MTDAFELIEYTALGTPMRGRLYKPANMAAPCPAVLVFPEGYGISDHTYRAAQRLNAAGYIAMACDLYGDAYYKNGGGPEIVAHHARITSTPGGLMAIGTSAHNALLQHPEVDPTRIAASGYCLGSAIAMELAFSGAQIAAVAGFHPSFANISWSQAATIRTRFAFFIGDDDFATPLPALNDAHIAMRKAGLHWRTTIYGNVKHSFTNFDCEVLNNPVLAYDEEADRHAHAEMLRLFAEAFARAD
jgi:dienelactone hydrolase